MTTHLRGLNASRDLVLVRSGRVSVDLFHDIRHFGAFVKLDSCPRRRTRIPNVVNAGSHCTIKSCSTNCIFIQHLSSTHSLFDYRTFLSLPKMKASVVASTLAAAVAVNAVGQYQQCGKLPDATVRLQVLIAYAHKVESTTLALPLAMAGGCAPTAMTTTANGEKPLLQLPVDFFLIEPWLLFSVCPQARPPPLVPLRLPLVLRRPLPALEPPRPHPPTALKLPPAGLAPCNTPALVSINLLSLYPNCGPLTSSLCFS